MEEFTIPIVLLGKTESASNANRAGNRKWRTESRHLWNYLRRDMRDATEERKKRFPRTYDRHVMRTVPLVYRLARELATLYIRPPSRTFEGDNITETTERTIAVMMDRIGINSALRSAQEQLVAIGNATVWVFPIPETGGVRLLVPPVHDQSVVMSEPTGNGIEDVECWYLRLPVGEDTATGIVSWGVAAISRDRAYWASAPSDLQGKGLWNEEGTNPLGRIPVAHLRSTEPEPGTIWSPCPSDLLQAQRAINDAMTDLGLVASMQSHGQPIIRGLPQATAAEMELGPETIIGLPDSDSDFAFAKASPDLKGYLDISNNYMETIVSTNGLNPQTIMKSSGITAVAKQVELHDRSIERIRTQGSFESAENQIYQCISDWVNIQGGVEIFPPAFVRLDWREVSMPGDPLHEAQRIERLVDLGITTSAQQLARFEGISIESAKAKVAQNIEETRTNREALKIDD